MDSVYFFSFIQACNFCFYFNTKPNPCCSTSKDWNRKQAKKSIIDLFLISYSKTDLQVYLAPKRDRSASFNNEDNEDTRFNHCIKFLSIMNL